MLSDTLLVLRKIITIDVQQCASLVLAEVVCVAASESANASTRRHLDKSYEGAYGSNYFELQVLRPNIRNMSVAGPCLVLVGGGHSHALVVAGLARAPLTAASITLVSREPLTPYSGMLPGVVAGLYERRSAHIDLASLCQRAGIVFKHATVVACDAQARRLLFADGGSLDYDVLSVDIGSTPDISADGAIARVVAVKPIADFLQRFDALVARIETVTAPLTIGVVGAGAGGTEMILAIREGLRRHLIHRPAKFSMLRFQLFVSGTKLLPGHNFRVREQFVCVCREQGIEVLLNAHINCVAESYIQTTGGARFDVDEVLWVTRARTQEWMQKAGFATDEKGFMLLQATLESTSHSGVFAAGDCANVVAHPRPKAGVFAVRQGPPLLSNLRRQLDGEPLREFIPQRQYLSLISTGPREAVVSHSYLPAIRGHNIWRWKNWLDRRFMQQF